VALAAISCASHPLARADDIRVDGDTCSAHLRVEAHDARLSDVLARLAAAAGFTLTFKSQSDPRIDFSGSGDAATLIARLVAGGNVTIVTGPAAACGGRERVTTVWVLPGGAKTAAASASSRVPASASHKAAATVPDAPVDPLYARSHGIALQLPGTQSP
jgi:hypothetical protein